MIDIDKVLESKDSLEEIQKLLSSQNITGQTTSGKIKVLMSCDKTLQDIIIDSSLTITTPEQITAFCKALISAFKDAEKKIKEKASELITDATTDEILA